MRFLKDDAMTSMQIGLSCSIGLATNTEQQRAFDHEVSPVCSCAKMVKVILIFNVFLVYSFPITTGKKLPNEIKGFLLHHTVDARYLPQRDDSSASKEVHERKLAQENTSRSTSVAYYAQKLFRLTHRSANPKLPLQVFKVRVFCIFIQTRLI